MQRVMIEQEPPALAPSVVSAQGAPSSRQQQSDILRDRAGTLELRLSDLSVKAGQLREQRDRASSADRPRLDKQLADAQHDVAATGIELSSTRDRINRLDLMPPAPATVTVQTPRYDPFPTSNQIVQLSTGGMLLMFPLVLALARRLWVRGPREVQTTDLDSSPRLQRMEQAIEAIAVEVERIGEAQRFATKLLAERPVDADLNRIAPAGIPAPRREPGTITPH